METKKQLIEGFENHVSSAKPKFYKKHNMEFVMGWRNNIRFKDVEGEKELINMHCNGGVYNLGHRNPIIVETLAKALEKFDIGNGHLISSERAKTAKLLSQLMPGDLDYTIFGVSGGEAVDTAIKIARGYTKKEKIISIVGGYHGHTGYALSTGDEKYRKPFGDKLPNFEQCVYGDIKSMENAIDNQTAAVILETIPATLGIPVPEYDYMQAVRKLCTQKNVLLISDEVQSGLGRTGKLWAFEHYDIIPDIVVLGKGLSGGVYPISATVIRKPIEVVFHEDPFVHVSTFGGSELGSVVMSKVLEISSSAEFLDNVNKMADIFKIEVEKLKLKYPKTLINLRQIGLMMGLEFDSDIGGPLFSKTAYDNGMFSVFSYNKPSVSQFLPPLIINEEQVHEVIERLDKALEDMEKLKMLAKAKNFVDGVSNKVKNIFK